ncbi:hypothetical protein HU200_014700 [Digitaria exilis]|uniref:Uncharacterized protein n=1 Tax=Digitaria exilis TaxID=1010633 RepID=A0A835FBN4_9POAL|nr:hypothetical protein HU200_014700 [Digitaria exilis]
MHLTGPGTPQLLLPLLLAQAYCRCWLNERTPAARRGATSPKTPPAIRLRAHAATIDKDTAMPPRLPTSSDRQPAAARRPAMESAASPSRAFAGVDLRWLLSVAAGGLCALLLILATSPSFRIPSASSSSRLFLSPRTSSSAQRPLPPLFVEETLSRPSPPPARTLPRFAYLISGSAGDAGMMRRCVLALYHPSNRYILHLDAEAPDSDRAGLAAFVAAHPVLVIEKANLVTYRGPTMVTTTLHAAAAFLWGDGHGRGADWDWFINLSASDYPLVTQDGERLSSPSSPRAIAHRHRLPRDLNFIDHTSNISWKAYVLCSSPDRESCEFGSWQMAIEMSAAMPVIIDPALYMKTKGDLFWVSERRSLPTAFKLFTGMDSLTPCSSVNRSAWMVLSRPFVEYLIWGWDNLPRTVLLYYANFISSPEGYFHTVACNAAAFRNTTVNSDLHFISWDNPPMQHPHLLTLADWDRMLASGAPFARKFPRDDPVLDRIDAEILARRGGPAAVAPGGWCAAAAAVNGSGGDPCAAVGNAGSLRPGPGAERLQGLVTSLLSEENFRPNQVATGAGARDDGMTRRQRVNLVEKAVLHGEALAQLILLPGARVHDGTCAYLSEHPIAVPEVSVAAAIPLGYGYRPAGLSPRSARNPQNVCSVAAAAAAAADDAEAGANSQGIRSCPMISYQTVWRA